MKIVFSTGNPECPSGYIEVGATPNQESATVPSTLVLLVDGVRELRFDMTVSREALEESRWATEQPLKLVELLPVFRFSPL